MGERAISRTTSILMDDMRDEEKGFLWVTNSLQSQVHFKVIPGYEGIVSEVKWMYKSPL